MPDTGRELHRNCYSVTIPTTGSPHDKANTKTFGLVEVADGRLFVIGPTLRSVAILFPEATSVRYVGPALNLDAVEPDFSDLGEEP